MVTKSFFKNVVINNKKDALMFAKALERAEKAAKKRKKIKVNYNVIEGEEAIKNYFKERRIKWNMM